MAAPAVGSVVLVRFPFSDLSDSKFRPAFVLADVGRGDYLLCQITSRHYSNKLAIQISDTNFERGSLERQSYVRPDKLFTANQSIIDREVGILTWSTWQSIIVAIGSVLRRDFPAE